MKRVSGLDVHKDSVYMCVLQENREKIEQKFGTLTPDLYRMREAHLHHQVEEVAMESTSNKYSRKTITDALTGIIGQVDVLCLNSIWKN